MKEGVKKEVPKEVELIAVLNIIGSIFLILIGIFLVIIKFIPVAEPQLMPDGGISFSFFSFILGMFSQTFLTLGLVFLPLGIFNLFVSIYLRKGRNWARICMIILMFMGVIGSVVSSIMGGDIVSKILGLIVPGLFGGYLLFNKKVKEAFS